MNRSIRKPRPEAYPLAGLIAAALIGLVVVTERGCKQLPEIRQQTERKPSDRMLAAMVPVADGSWFFKVTGPRDAVGELTDKFTKMVQSVKFDKEGKPIWKLPAGWKQEVHGINSMRYATISTETKTFKVTVNRFPTTEELENVNRWRRQMGLFQFWNETDMRTETISLALADGKRAILCNFIGTAPKGDGMPPFAKGMKGMGGAGHPPMKQPSSSQGSQAAAATSGRIGFDAPKEWKAEPASEMRTASFSIKTGNDTGEVTVMDLRHGKDDLKATVDIWRNAIGLEPMDRGELSKQVKDITIQTGQKGHYIEMAGTKSSLLGALVVHGDFVWVIKLKGSASLVKQERQRFRTFIQSLRLSPKE